MEQNQKLYLFQLIKSLSASEKGYVKKFCAKNDTDAAYLRLFDAIEEQEEYDEDLLKKKFKKEQFIKQLSVAKNYLIKTILRSLRAYYSESSNNIQVHELLLEIEILYNKRMIGLCQKLIKKAKKLIEDCQLFHHAEELAFWDFRLTLLTPFNDEMETHMQENQQFGESNLELALLLSKYRHLAYDVYKHAFKEGYSRAEESKKVAADFAKHPLLQTPPTKSAQALGRYHNIWTKIHEINTDFEKGYESTKSFVEVIQNNPLVFEDYVMATVVPAYYNLLASCILLNKENTFFKNLPLLKAIPQTYKSVNETTVRLIHYYAIGLELQFYTQNAHFDKTPLVLEEAKKIVEENNLMAFGLVLFHIELSYSIAYAYFGLGNYDESETWIARTLDYQKDNLREDIMCMANLLHLVNHAEMGSFQYLDNKIRTTYNFIKKMQKVHQFETVALQFLKKLTNVQNNSAFLELIRVYKQKFEELEQDPFERMIFKNFDITSWLDSKLRNKRFMEVAAERRNVK